MKREENSVEKKLDVPWSNFDFNLLSNYGNEIFKTFGLPFFSADLWISILETIHFYLPSDFDVITPNIDTGMNSSWKKKPRFVLDNESVEKIRKGEKKIAFVKLMIDASESEKTSIRRDTPKIRHLFGERVLLTTENGLLLIRAVNGVRDNL